MRYTLAQLRGYSRAIDLAAARAEVDASVAGAMQVRAGMAEDTPFKQWVRNLNGARP